MSNVVLDASALLALLNGERSADFVEAAMAADGAVMSVVNWAEVLSKAIETGSAREVVRERLERAGILGAALRIELVTEEDAATIARLRPLTRAAGLGLGDRACLALAKRLGAPAITTDAIWTSISAVVGVDVRLARSGWMRTATLAEVLRRSRALSAAGAHELDRQGLPTLRR